MAYPLPRLDDFRIAIICALPLEYDAVTFAVDEFWPENTGAPGNRHACKTGRIGNHNVVLLLLPDMGKVSAASAAASLRSVYTGIELAILTGICGGVPSPGANNEVVLGDVIISKSIVQYDLGRQYSNEFARKDTVEDSLGRPNKEIRYLVSTFETRQGRRDLQRRAGEILSQIQKKAADDGEQALYQQPSSKEDLLFEPGYLHRHRDQQTCGCSESGACGAARNASCETLQCDERRLVRRERLSADARKDACLLRDLRVFIGRIGSGDTVMKSGADRDRVAAEHGLVAFEMEGAGVWDEIPCVIVKAVCDYADSHKNKSWQNYAAATAASTMKALLEHYTSTRTRSDTPIPSSRHFVVPYNENPDFVGRNGVLELIKTQFGHGRQQTATKARSRIALHGLGGVGKTQIALAYVYWLKEMRPDVSIFWVHASNAQRFRQAYASIAEVYDIPGRDDPTADSLFLVKKWLEKEDRGPWFMVVDNADDTGVFFQAQDTCMADATANGSEKEGNLARYIPECRNGSILITTRNKQTGSRLAPGKPATKVDKLTDDEADQMLRSMLEEPGSTVSAEDASALSARLEHLPLALAQAAAFIQENEISIRQYVKLLDRSDTSLVKHLSEPFEAVGRDSSTPHALTATWVISFEQIEKQNAMASEVLSLISFFDRQAIPSEFINTYCHERQAQDTAADPEETEMTVTKALGTLKAFSFITETTDQSVDMHRLAQAVTQKWLVDRKRAARFSQQALQIVSDAYPFGEHETRETCREYLPHAYAVLNCTGPSSQDGDIARANLLHCLSGYHLYLGHWNEAEKMLIQALELRKGALGQEHPGTLDTMGNLASVYGYQGRLGEAEKLQASELEIQNRVFGEENPATLIGINNLALTYQEQGRWDEAEKLQASALEIQKRVLGEEHADTLTSMNNLTSIYRHQGRWEEAEKLQSSVLEIRKRVLGEEHPDTLTSMSNLALAYQHQERWEEAEKLQASVLEIRKRVLREEHPDTLISMNNLAVTYQYQERWEEAEKLQVSVLEIRKRVLREEHPDTLISINNLAVTYQHQERWEEAEKLQASVLEIWKRVLGVEHLDTLSSMGNLACTYWGQGRLEEAEDLEVRELEMRKKVFGDDHPDTLTSMESLAITYRDQGRLEEANGLEIQVEEIRKKKLGRDTTDMVTSMDNLTVI